MTSLLPVTGLDALGESDTWKRLRAWLCTYEPVYPSIQKWVDRKVRPGLTYAHRRALLVVDDAGEVAGAGIVKDGMTTTKLCHLSVSPHVQHTGVGVQLMGRLLERTAGDQVFLTMPESVWETHGGFFRAWGFIDPAAHVKHYRPGDRELLLWSPKYMLTRPPGRNLAA